MVRRGPASVCTRKSRSKRFSRIALTGFRPPPCMPDDDDPTWSVSRWNGAAPSSGPAHFGRCRPGLRGSHEGERPPASGQSPGVLLCLRLHARPSGATLDHRHIAMTGHPCRPQSPGEGSSDRMMQTPTNWFQGLCPWRVRGRALDLPPFPVSPAGNGHEADPGMANFRIGTLVMAPARAVDRLLDARRSACGAIAGQPGSAVRRHNTGCATRRLADSPQG